jgi:hypothetical protein
MSQMAQSSALTDTQPRVATPPPSPAHAAPQRATDPATGGVLPRDTNKHKRVTDSAHMPALRLNRRERGRAQRVEDKPPMVYDSQRAPGYLRLARLGIGLAALVGAWGVALLVVYLAQALWTVAPHQPVLTERYALYLMCAVGVLWLAVVALGMIVVGAFSLFLALTRGEW